MWGGMSLEQAKRARNDFKGGMSLMHAPGLGPTALPHGDMIIGWWPKWGANWKNGQNWNDIQKHTSMGVVRRDKRNGGDSTLDLMFHWHPIYGVPKVWAEKSPIGPMTAHG